MQNIVSYHLLLILYVFVFILYNQHIKTLANNQIMRISVTANSFVVIIFLIFVSKFLFLSYYEIFVNQIFLIASSDWVTVYNNIYKKVSRKPLKTCAHDSPSFHISSHLDVGLHLFDEKV